MSASSLNMDLVIMEARVVEVNTNDSLIVFTKKDTILAHRIARNLPRLLHSQLESPIVHLGSYLVGCPNHPRN